jgi:hypothetical protein
VLIAEKGNFVKMRVRLQHWEVNFGEIWRNLDKAEFLLLLSVVPALTPGGAGSELQVGTCW